MQRSGGSVTDYQLIQGDCREAMAAMLPESVDACITDPPFGTENGNGYGRRQNYGGKQGRVIAGDADLAAFVGALPSIYRALRPDAWFVFLCSPRIAPKLEAITAVGEAGFEVWADLVWDKGAPGLGKPIMYAHESIIIARKGEPEVHTVPLLSIVRAHSSIRINAADRHPHEKPVPLMSALVRWLCPPDAVVLDPFTGSGTTGIACIKEGRRFIGCELNPEYIEIARRRIEAEQPTLFAAFAAG